MKDLSILQLSDCCAAHMESGAVEALIAQLRSHPAWPFDYLAVCGNLTGEGKAEEFDAAEAHLRLLAQQLLNKGETSPGSRVLIVPGPRNQRNTDNAYKKFWDHWYEEVPTLRKQSGQAWWVAMNHRVTLLGGAWWTGRSFDEFHSAISSVATQMSDHVFIAIDRCS